MAQQGLTSLLDSKSPYFLIHRLVVFTSGVSPWLQLTFPPTDLDEPGGKQSETISIFCQEIRTALQLCASIHIYACTLHIVAGYENVRAYQWTALPFIIPIPLLNSDSLISLNSGSVTISIIPFTQKIVPVVSHTRQVLTVCCLTGNELNYIFYLCLTDLWNLRGAGTPHILLLCQC